MAARRILVIDDDPYVLQILKLCLEALGDFSIHYAPDGRRGAKLVETCRPDLILLDYDLPGQDGLETLHVLRADARCASTPIVAITGALRLTQRCREMIQHCDAYLAKPFEFTHLRQVVLKTLATRPAGSGTQPLPAASG